MSKTVQLRCLLMSAEYNNGTTGFHKIAYKVDQGRGQNIGTVSVMISVDAVRKLSAQLLRARLPRIDRDRLLLSWAKWEIQLHMEDHGTLPKTITVTASDLDDFGAYAHGFGNMLLAS